MREDNWRITFTDRSMVTISNAQHEFLRQAIDNNDRIVQFDHIDVNLSYVVRIDKLADISDNPAFRRTELLTDEERRLLDELGRGGEKS